MKEDVPKPQNQLPLGPAYIQSRTYSPRSKLPLTLNEEPNTVAWYHVVVISGCLHQTMMELLSLLKNVAALQQMKTCLAGDLCPSPDIRQYSLYLVGNVGVHGTGEHS